MENTKSDATRQVRFIDQAQNNALLTFDLPSLIKKMKQSNSWAEGELNARVLLKSPDKQILLTAIHGGTEINSFQSKDSVTLQIIEGSLRFYTRKRSVNLEMGQLLTLNDNIRYSLTCKEETVFLLTIISGRFDAHKN